MTRRDQIAAERNTVLNICAAYAKRSDRLAAWSAQTGKSQSAFYRRFQELQREGLLSA